MKSKKVLLEFKNSHHYWEEYKKTKLYCPNCGDRKVWKEQGVGDYYEGTEHACTDCGFMFTMPSGQIRKDAWGEIPKQLKSGKSNKPTTPKGN